MNSGSASPPTAPPPTAPQPPTPLLKNPLAAGNKGIAAAIGAIILTLVSPLLTDYLPPWLQVDPNLAVPTVALSLQNLFARLRHRREAKKAAAAGSK
jgi:hypothetical protein